MRRVFLLIYGCGCNWCYKRIVPRAKMFLTAPMVLIRRRLLLTYILHATTADWACNRRRMAVRLGWYSFLSVRLRDETIRVWVVKMGAEIPQHKPSCSSEWWWCQRAYTFFPSQKPWIWDLEGWVGQPQDLRSNRMDCIRWRPKCWSDRAVVRRNRDDVPHRRPGCVRSRLARCMHVGTYPIKSVEDRGMTRRTVSAGPARPRLLPSLPPSRFVAR